MNLSQDWIEHLEAFGFRWSLRVTDRSKTFEERCCDLNTFKSEFGHCDVLRADPALGQWCRSMRYTYNMIQKGKKPNRNLAQDRIERLEGIGFHWTAGDRK